MNIAETFRSATVNRSPNNHACPASDASRTPSARLAQAFAQVGRMARGRVDGTLEFTHRPENSSAAPRLVREECVGRARRPRRAGPQGRG